MIEKIHALVTEGFTHEQATLALEIIEKVEKAQTVYALKIIGGAIIGIIVVVWIANLFSKANR